MFSDPRPRFPWRGPGRAISATTRARVLLPAYRRVAPVSQSSRHSRHRLSPRLRRAGYDPTTHAGRGHQVLRPFTRWILRRANRVVAVCESLDGCPPHDPGLATRSFPRCGPDPFPSVHPAPLPDRQGALPRGRAAGGAQGNRRPDPGVRVARARRFELEIVGSGRTSVSSRTSCRCWARPGGGGSPARWTAVRWPAAAAS